MHVHDRIVSQERAHVGLAPTAEIDAPTPAYAYGIAVVAAMAGLLFGFDIAVISGAIIFIREQFALTELQTEIAVGSLLVGCIAGAMIAGRASDRLGRRRTLRLAAILFGISSIAAGLPHQLVPFIAARLLAGIATGAASMLAPMYIAENSPPSLRGRLISFNQLAIVLGILLAYLVNWGLATLGSEGWRWMFAAAAVPAFALWVALLFVPESPRWLIQHGFIDQARAVLTRIGGTQHAELEAREIVAALAMERVAGDDLWSRRYRLPLIIAVALAVLQQITGVNTVLYYGSLIFHDHMRGQTTGGALALNVLVGLVNLLGTLVALSIIDRVGRKPLLLASSGVMGFALLLLGGAFRMTPVPSVAIFAIILCYVFAFAIGLGPAVWVLMAEVFPTHLRGRAMSIATISLWIASLALTVTFLSLVTAIGASGTFWLYAVLCLATFLFVWRVVPETKGRSLEQIERMWGQK